jgi:hypothetical protein
MDVNEAFLKVLGYTRDDILGKTLTGLKIYSDIGIMETMIEELHEKGIIKNREVTIRARKQIVEKRIAYSRKFGESGSEILFNSYVGYHRTQHAHQHTLQLLFDMAKSFINLPLEKADNTINNALKTMGKFVELTVPMSSGTISRKTHFPIHTNGVPKGSLLKLITFRTNPMNTFLNGLKHIFNTVNIFCTTFPHCLKDC